MHHFQPEEKSVASVPVSALPFAGEDSSVELSAGQFVETNAEDKQAVEEMEALFATMRGEVVRQRRWNLAIKWVLGIWLGGLLIYSALAFTEHWHFSPGLFQLFNLVNVLTATVLNNKQRKEAVARLSQLREKRAVGPLCDVLGFNNGEMRTLARKALIELLPTLQASDAPLLNAEQRAHLYSSLSQNDLPFTLVILKALEQIGDGKALPTVQKLAHAEAATSRQKEVREAARTCLPFLEERAERERISSTLLRASGPEIRADVLLRPATETPSTPVSELLRAPVEPPAGEV